MWTRRFVLMLSLGSCLTLGGCGDSATSTDLPKIDQAQARAAEEATAKAQKDRPRPQTKRY
jgi:hypothetical protein